MRKVPRPFGLPLLACLLAVTACSSDPPNEEPDKGAPGTPTTSVVGEATPVTSASPGGDPAGAVPEPKPSPVAGRHYAYSSLENCKVIRQEREEMPVTEVACRGVGSYSLQVLDSDARQVMTLVPPTSELYRVPTARIGGGGFSSFGRTVEWRGPRASAFEPDSMIVRYDVAENPPPAPETSYLLVVRLGDDPCLVAAVPPGPRQNETARRKADDPGACLAG